MILRIRIALLFVAALFVARTTQGQTIPGHWRRAALPNQRYGDNTSDFHFRDSLNGICVSNYAEIYATTNGGRIWSLEGNLGQPVNKSTLNSAECTAALHGLFHTEWHTIKISPGNIWRTSVPNQNEPNIGSYLPLAEKMYDTAYGFRLVQYVSTHSKDDYQDSVVILVTHDGWQSSSWYGQGYDIYPYPGANIVMHIGYIVDSNDIWMAKGASRKPNVIIHTSNGGVTWQTMNVVDTLRYQPLIEDLMVNPQTHEVYGKGNLSALDFVYSSDYGSTWRADSTFGQRLWRMANPAPGILWATISEGGIANTQINPGSDAFVRPNEYSRKIAYSSNNGFTWAIDSTTFLNDSLEDLHFSDTRHGWVASWSHDSVFMWYYEADAASDVAESPAPSSDLMFVLPNPAQSSITVNGAGKDLEIFDALGRSHECPRNGNTLDISRLPAGVYYVSDGGSTNGAPRRARFVKE